MNYKLSNENEQVKSASRSAKELLSYLAGERMSLVLAVIFVLINSATTIAGPLLIGYAVDNFLFVRDLDGITRYSVLIIINYVIGFGSDYLQLKGMGGVGLRVLYRLRNQLFQKLLSLPLSFFNQNKAGDLISRLNNDTEKVNQFFSEVLVQLVGSMMTMLGIGAFLLLLNWRLGAVALIPAVFLFAFTQVVLPWMRRRNLASLQSLGSLSAEVQQSLENFKVIVAFNRRDYFQQKFSEVNAVNYRAALRSGIAGSVISPLYDFASTVAIWGTLAFGFTLILQGSLTAGVLVTYMSYLNQFYGPLRRMSQLWTAMQSSLAGWGRITEILQLESDLPMLSESSESSDALLEFRNVGFAYPGGDKVLSGISFKLMPGKTYALVGPTGGGKTTTAGLVARLFDPAEGTVLLGGRDIRTYTDEERTDMIGFILQDPLLFTGTLRENIVYGNPDLSGLTDEQLVARLTDAGLSTLIATFAQGLDSEITSNANNISLGQKQIIAFIRAIMRHPKLLILDEATANLDTVTEQMLDQIMAHLPADTTKVVIAHRLNTISNADDIFFVNSGKVEEAGTLERALEMLIHKHKSS